MELQLEVMIFLQTGQIIQKLRINAELTQEAVGREAVRVKGIDIKMGIGAAKAQYPRITGNDKAVPRYTYFIVDSSYSAYRPGKVVSEEMVGERLEDTAATGVYVFADGRTEEDETLRCEIFALTGVDPGIAVCVRFIDKGKGLTTDHYYLLYNPEADTSAIEAYLIPQVEANNEE